MNIHAAKKEKNRNESRIRYLERMIKTAEVISDESKDDEIGLNKIVELYFEDEDDVETYKIVTTVRGNFSSGTCKYRVSDWKSTARTQGRGQSVDSDQR